MQNGQGGKTVIPYDDVNDLSIHLMEEMDRGGIGLGVRELATALTLGRLMAYPRKLSFQEEELWLDAVLDFATSMWAEGGAN